MAYDTKFLLRDAENNIIPQYYDPETDSFKPLQGTVDVNVTNQAGIVVEDYFEGSTTMTRNYDSDMTGVSIANDGIENLTFTVNDVTRTVYAGEPYNGTLKPFRSITVTATDKFRCEVLK